MMTTPHEHAFATPPARRPQYTRPEKIADGVIHAVGVPAGIAGAVVLVVIAALGAEWPTLLSVTLYGIGLIGMLVGSAAYNLVEHPARKELLRRLDRAGIFVMIAGTYTPFTVVSVGGWTGAIYCAGMWLAAAAGVTIKLRWPRRLEGLAIGLYLAMGWSVLAMVPRLATALSTGVLVLLLVGGVLYTLGVGFHLARRLRFHNAVWHAFVLVAASLHYVAVLQGVALGG
jgi:hemolysin III